MDDATTQVNLGLAHEESGNLPAAIACWREAAAYYKQMGYIDHADEMRRWIDMAEDQMNANSLGGADAADEGEGE